MTLSFSNQNMLKGNNAHTDWHIILGIKSARITIIIIYGKWGFRKLLSLKFISISQRLVDIFGKNLTISTKILFDVWELKKL